MLGVTIVITRFGCQKT